MEKGSYILLLKKERYTLGNAYYGRRPSMRGVPMPCGRRTATYGLYEAENTVTSQECNDMVLAMAYIPVQQFDTLFEIEAGFDRGTVFPELEKPFMGGGCGCGI